MENGGFFANPRSWVAVAFVLFFVVFGRKLWTALTAQLDGRSAAIRAELDQALALRREAEAMLNAAQAERDAALKDARLLIENSKAEALRLTAQAHADAEASGKRRERMAHDRIAAAEKAAVTEVRMAAADVATRAAERIIGSGLDPDTDMALVDHAIAGLPAALRAA